MPPLTGAAHVSRFGLWREHVIVHADQHGDEHNRVVEQVQLYAREHQLQNAEGHGLMPKIVVRRSLVNQQNVLNVMPELDRQRNRPPVP